MDGRNLHRVADSLKFKQNFADGDFGTHRRTGPPLYTELPSPRSLGAGCGMPSKLLFGVNAVRVGVDERGLADDDGSPSGADFTTFCGSRSLACRLMAWRCRPSSATTASG
jgi:hypothetical protein